MDITGMPSEAKPREYNASSLLRTIPSECFDHIDLSEYTENLRWLTGNVAGAPQNRKHNTAPGRQASHWIQEKCASYCGSRCTSVLYQHQRTPQPSVIVRYNARTPRNDQVVIIGAHLDSTASGDRAPGADDDGTGTITVMAALHALLECGWEPNVNVEFQMYAAEEVGLWGSQEIAQAYSNQGVNVKSMIQFDMNGCCSASSGLTRGTRFNVCTDAAFTNSALTARLRQYITATATLQQGNFAYGYAASDHASFARAGFPACHVKENVGYSPIHSANDNFNNIDFVYLMNFVKVAIQFAVSEAA